MKIRIFLFLLTTLASSCTNNASEPIQTGIVINDPVGLIDGFKSYESIETVKQHCNSLGYDWIVIEDSKLSPGDKRPRFDIFVVEINGYKHLKATGILRLKFYNDRLSDTWFYPEKHEIYLNTLLQERNIDLINVDEKTIGNLRIWKRKDYREKLYIGWLDIRLEQEEFEWIKKYS